MPPTRDMNLIEVAFTLANEAHWKVRSLRGRPYIFHAIRVMEQMDTDEECAVALLHEVLEDSSPSLPVEMLEKWLPENVVEAVKVLTRAPGREHETYAKYIERISSIPLAAKVKLADLKDNLRWERIPEVKIKELEQMGKYVKAVACLQGHEIEGVF